MVLISSDGHWGLIADVVAAVAADGSVHVLDGRLRVLYDLPAGYVHSSRTLIDQQGAARAPPPAGNSVVAIAWRENGEQHIGGIREYSNENSLLNMIS